MEKKYKRTSKTLSPEVRDKIAATMRGRKREESVKAKISNGMKKYWNNPNNFPDDAPRHEGTGNGWTESGDIV